MPWVTDTETHNQSEYRERVTGVLSWKWGIFTTPLLPRAPGTSVKGAVKILRTRLLGESIFWKQRNHCTSELTAPVTVCTRPAKDQASQIASMDGEKLLAEKLLAEDGH